jgi:hypothetical protein
MTEMSVFATNAVRRSNSLRLKISTLRIGASLASLFALLGDALTMAYVEPYTTHRRTPKDAPDENLQGRDPNW